MEESDTKSYNEDVSEKIRGECRNSSLIFESDYISNINAFPSIKAIYKQDYYENRREEDLSGFSINRQTKRRIYTPNFILHEKVEDFLGGRFSTVIHVDLYFKEEKVNRDSDEIDDLELEEYVSALEEEMRQRSGARINIHYRNKIFFIYPSMSVSSHEVVKLKGKSELNDTEVLNDVNGGFHFPLIYNKDFKFVEREKKFGLKYGVLFLKPLFPNLSLDLSYNENRFKDYDENQLMLSGKFSRAKDSDSMILNRIELPFEFRRNKNVLFLKNLNLGYSRSIYFHENNIPYEGEGISSFDERYGVKRVYNKFSRSGINLFHTPPWYFFQGRENYANGRDYVYNTFNEGLVYFDGSDVTDYNNTLRIIDNYWAGLTFDFGRIILDSGGGITQVTERQMIYGIPRQVITFSYNININFDLMKIFNFWFFRSNEIGQPFHSSNLLIGYNFNRNMLITSNIEEYSHSPNVGITFKWDRSSVGLRLGLDYMHKSKREFISQDDSKRSSKDDIYINNMQTIESFKEVDYGYQLSVLYETDVQSIYNFFSQFYKLVSFPIVSLEYSLLLNRYDYSETVSPEPYDQHLVTGKLTMDLHENIQGGVRARYALERFRNRDTEGINREIRSYEIALNFSLLF